jgi:hypothetical protein
MTDLRRVHSKQIGSKKGVSEEVYYTLVLVV